MKTRPEVEEAFFLQANLLLRQGRALLELAALARTLRQERKQLRDEIKEIKRSSLAPLGRVLFERVRAAPPEEMEGQRQAQQRKAEERLARRRKGA